MLKALYDYALRENLILPPGYTLKNICAYISLSKKGEFLGIFPVDTGKVPCPDIGSLAQSGNKCNVLAEKRGILFPSNETQRAKYAAKAEYFQQTLADAAKVDSRLHLCLDAMNHQERAEMVSKELDQMDVNDSQAISFMVDGQSILEMPAVQNWWEQFRQQFLPNGHKVPCLITGELTVSLATVPTISGLHAVGGHARGDALICFDKEAFRSYGLKQAANAPVSEKAFAGVKAALDNLLEDAPILAGMKFVHWYDKPLKTEEDYIEQIFSPGLIEEDDDDDNEEAEEFDVNLHEIRRQADDLVNSVKTGEAVHELPNLYYIVLLSGVNGRVMIRAYQEGNYQQLTTNLKQWEQDLQLVDTTGTGIKKPVKLNARLIRLMARQKSDTDLFKRMNKELSGLTPAIITAILNGTQLPNAVISRALAYIRSQMFSSDDDQKQNKQRGRKVPDSPAEQNKKKTRKVPDSLACQWLKVWLCRREREKYQKEELSVEYNEKHPEPAYHCGALVAIYGAIQGYVMPDVNTTLIDRYYASASQTPALVLGQLARMSNYHFSKLEKLRPYFSDLRDQVACAIGPVVPAVLLPEQQAYFALGYYQMCAKLEKDRRERKAAKAQKEAEASAPTDTQDNK